MKTRVRDIKTNEVVIEVDVTTFKLTDLQKAALFILIDSALDSFIELTSGEGGVAYGE